MRPRIRFGMALYNNSTYLPQAIESLLTQTYGDFCIVAVDDGSTDDTEYIMQQYLSQDKRISYYRNESRQGMIATWRRAFTEAQQEPTDYFAWASDHDVWHPRWLEMLVQVLNEHPKVVMAYPLTVRISDTGENLHVPSPVFDTFGLDVRGRIEALYSKGVGFGNMIYGLFRADALRKAGVFRSLLLPDVVLLWELALYGSYKQIHEELWFRRYAGQFSIERQKRNLFAKPPWYFHLPYPLVNSAVLAWNTVSSSRAGGLNSRYLGLCLTWMHFLKYAPSYPGRWTKSRLAKIGWLKKLYRMIKKCSQKIRQGDVQ